MSSVDLLETLRKKFIDSKASTEKKNSILSLIKTWLLVDHAADFMSNSEMSKKLDEFCNEISNQTISDFKEKYEKIAWNFRELTKEKAIMKVKTIPEKLPLKEALEDYREQFIEFMKTLKTTNTRLLEFFDDLQSFKMFPSKDKAEHMLQMYLKEPNPIAFINTLAMDTIQQNIKSNNVSKHLFNKVEDVIDQELQIQSMPIFLKHLKSSSQNKTNSTKSLQPKRENFEIQDIEPIELARQISLLLMKKFQKIKRIEFLNKNYEKPEMSPNMTKTREFHQHLENLVIAEILKNPYHQDEANSYAYFVDVAEELHRLNNFFALGSILGGLIGSAVQKLKKPISLLDKKTISKLDKLSQIMKHDDQFQTYNQAMKSTPASQPAVPLLHASKGLPALTKINEVENDVLSEPEGWVNWHKMIIISKVIRNIKRPRPPYQFQAIKKIQEVIKNTEGWPYENLNCKISILRNETETWNRPVSKLLTSQLWDSQWADLTEKDWKIILSSTQAQVVNYDEQDVIVDANEDNKFIYRLTSGEITIVKNQSGLPPILKAPNTFGELAMFIQMPAPSRIIAVTNVTLYKISINSLIKLCIADSEISRKFNHYIAWKLARRMKRKLEDSKIRKSMDVIRIAKPRSGHTINRDREKKLREMLYLSDDQQIYGEFECFQTVAAAKKRPGKLIITNKCLYFKARKAFGGKKIIPIPYHTINYMELIKGKIRISWNHEGSNDVIKLQNFEKVEEVYQTADLLYRDCKPIIHSKLEDKSGDRNTTDSSDSNNTLEISEEDWKTIIKGAKNLRFREGDIIVNIGEKLRKLYQIVTGKVEIISETKKITLSKKEIFGEMAFLNEEGASTFSVIALEKTEIVVIESYYLDVIFQHFPPLAGRFYFYLTQIICRRLVDVDYY